LADFPIHEMKECRNFWQRGIVLLSFAFFFSLSHSSSFALLLDAPIMYERDIRPI